MEYSQIYVRRIRKLCKAQGITTNRLAFNMTLAEFLDFDELNEYAFDDDFNEE